MKTYIAIGYFKFNGVERTQSVAMKQKTMAAFREDLKGNEFVAYAVFTAERFQKLQSLGWMDRWYEVKKMVSNYRKWDLVDEYIEQCSDIIEEKIAAAE